MNFFDIIGQMVPSCLYNYDDIIISERNETINFRNKEDFLEIYRGHSGFAMRYIGNANHFHLIITEKKDKDTKFSDIIRVGHSFKNVRSVENIEILDASIGLLFMHNANNIIYIARSYDQKTHSNIFKFQDEYKNINFKLMNKILSSVYTLSYDKMFLNRHIRSNINFDQIPNHQKIKFIEKFEKYCDSNKAKII